MPLAFGSRTLDMQIIMERAAQDRMGAGGASRQPPLDQSAHRRGDERRRHRDLFLSDLRKAAGIAAGGGEAARAQLTY